MTSAFGGQRSIQLSYGCRVPPGREGVRQAQGTLWTRRTITEGRGAGNRR